MTNVVPSLKAREVYRHDSPTDSQSISYSNDGFELNSIR